MPERDKDRITFSNKVYEALNTLAQKETKNWEFNRWYRDGIDWYLAREMVYLVTLWLDDDDEDNQEILEELKEYTPEELAWSAYRYATSMDDFQRLWQGDDSKRRIIQEYLEELDYQRSKNGKDSNGESNSN